MEAGEGKIRVCLANLAKGDDANAGESLVSMRRMQLASTANSAAPAMFNGHSSRIIQLLNAKLNCNN